MTYFVQAMDNFDCVVEYNSSFSLWQLFLPDDIMLQVDEVGSTTWKVMSRKTVQH